MPLDLEYELIQTYAHPIRIAVLFRTLILIVSMSAALYGIGAWAQDQSSTAVSIAQNTQRIGEVERRVGTLETDRLDSRIVRLEALSESNHDLLLAVFVCLLGLSGEAAYRLVGRRKGEL